MRVSHGPGMTAEAAAMLNDRRPLTLLHGTSQKSDTTLSLHLIGKDSVMWAHRAAREAVMSPKVGHIATQI